MIELMLYIVREKRANKCFYVIDFAYNEHHVQFKRHVGIIFTLDKIAENFEKLQDKNFKINKIIVIGFQLTWIKNIVTHERFNEKNAQAQ